MQRLWPALVGLLSLAGLAGAPAQGEERTDAARGHGGQVQAVGPYRLELMVDPRELTLYVTDEAGAPVDTFDGSAKAIITGGKDRYVVILSPAGGNVLKGSADYSLGAYNLISLMMALPDRELQHAKFVHPKGAKPPPKKAKKKKRKKSAKKKPATSTP